MRFARRISRIGAAVNESNRFCETKIGKRKWHKRGKNKQHGASQTGNKSFESL